MKSCSCPWVSMSPVLVAMVVLAGMAPTLKAELPVREYRRMQREAPEELRIRTVRVKEHPVAERGREGRTIEVTVEAKVQRILRSAARIHDGELITISYVVHRRARPLPGPGETPVLERDQEYPAFLEKIPGERRHFRPAAGAYSFQRIEERR